MASAEYRPCLYAFLFPVGAPGDVAPCIRQRPFGVAGDWHGIPLRVLAPQRELRCMGNLLCRGLILWFFIDPHPPGARPSRPPLARLRCEKCSHTLIAYNSCRDRHCPKCQGAAAQEWLAAREVELLPVPYFHAGYLPRRAISRRTLS